MIKELYQLVDAGEWATLRTKIPVLMRQATGEDRLYLRRLYVSALFHTAKKSRDLRAALRHAQICLATAEEGSVPHAWALHVISSLNLSLGRFDQVEAYANRFLTVVGAHPSLYQYIAKAYRALFHVQYAKKDYDNAIPYAKQALEMFTAQGNEDEAYRTRCNLTWTLLKAGRVTEARETLPTSVSEGLAFLYLSVTCAVLAAEKQDAAALAVGKEAMGTPRSLHDEIGAHDVACTLVKVATALKLPEVATDYATEAASCKRRQWGNTASIDAQLKIAKGGEQQHESPSLPGSERAGNSLTCGVG